MYAYWVHTIARKNLIAVCKKKQQSELLLGYTTSNDVYNT